MVGHATLDRVIGVRIPASQPEMVRIPEGILTIFVSLHLPPLTCHL